MKAISAVIAVLLCTAGMIGPAKSDDDEPRDWPSPYFKGVKMMSYQSYIDRTGGCAVDWKAWDTAIDFVANQSVKLKLIRQHDHYQQGRQLADEMSKVTAEIIHHMQQGTLATVEKELDKRRDEATDRYDKYVWIPRISFYIETMDLVNGCAGSVRAEVDVVLENAKIKATDSTMLAISGDLDRQLLDDRTA